MCSAPRILFSLCASDVRAGFGLPCTRTVEGLPSRCPQPRLSARRFSSEQQQPASCDSPNGPVKEFYERAMRDCGQPVRRRGRASRLKRSSARRFPPHPRAETSTPRSVRAWYLRPFRPRPCLRPRALPACGSAKSSSRSWLRLPNDSGSAPSPAPQPATFSQCRGFHERLRVALIGEQGFNFTAQRLVAGASLFEKCGPLAGLTSQRRMISRSILQHRSASIASLAADLPQQRHPASSRA